MLEINKKKIINKMIIQYQTNKELWNKNSQTEMNNGFRKMETKNPKTTNKRHIARESRDMTKKRQFYTRNIISSKSGTKQRNKN